MSDGAGTVWLFEIVEYYAPSYGLEVFSTLERAKAYRPEVDWEPDEDGGCHQPHDDMETFYSITPMRIDPNLE